MYDELIKNLRLYMNDGDDEIRNQAADAIEELQAQLMYSNDAAKAIAERVPKWIEFIMRELDEEEKAEHPEWLYIMDCDLPDDGQEILVSNGRWVWKDEFINNVDGCYLDRDADLEGLWWMPLPEPPKEEK